MLVIREETPRDVGQVRMINIAASEQPDEADLVDALRSGCPEVVSLVAELDGRVVGHILRKVPGMPLCSCVVAPPGRTPMERPRVGTAWPVFAAVLITAALASAQDPCQTPCDLATLETAIDNLAGLEAFKGPPVYVEDGACDGSVAALPPDYRPPPEVLAILMCAQCAAPVLIDHLDDPRQTTARFEGGQHWNGPISVPLGYLCLDLLRVITTDESQSFDPTSVNDDDLGSGIMPSFYFRPDAFQQSGPTLIPSHEVALVKRTWKVALAEGTLRFRFQQWW
jgi:hypothetical protein